LLGRSRAAERHQRTRKARQEILFKDSLVHWLEFQFFRRG
jgi:hypothetical protein